MTTPDELNQAKARLRAYANGTSTRPVLTAAAVVLNQLDEMEGRARKLYAAADPGERRDAVLENIQVACRYILGETESVTVKVLMWPPIGES